MEKQMTHQDEAHGNEGIAEEIVKGVLEEGTDCRYGREFFDEIKAALDTKDTIHQKKLMDLRGALKNVQTCLVLRQQFGSKSIEWADLLIGVDKALSESGMEGGRG